MTTSFRSAWRRYGLYYILLAPGVLFLLIYRYIPMAGIAIAFKDISPFEGLGGIISSPWVGFSHFKRFFGSYYFLNVLSNTLTINFWKILVGFPIPVLLAIMINEVRSPAYRRIVQTISYLPHFISWVVVAGLMNILLSSSSGIVNGAIRAMGGESVLFLGDPKVFVPVLVASALWKTIGWESIIFLAALTGVDPSLYESAVMDGTKRWQRILYITLPSIAPIIVIMFIFRVGRLVDMDFEQILLLYSPAVYGVSDIIDTYVYREGLERLAYSYATAVGLFKSAVAFLLIASTNWAAKRLGHDGIW